MKPNLSCVIGIKSERLICLLYYFKMLAFIVFLGLVRLKMSCAHETLVLPGTVTARALNNSVNVKTVLFREPDTCKVCWSKEDLNLLIARRLVQDLIPRRIPKDFPALYLYINNVVETVKAKTSEKNLNTMLLATYDAFGGYLHAVVIPVLNEAYYAGNVDFTTTSNIHTLLGTMKEYLGTNGNAWAPPCDMRRIPTKVAALPIRMCKTEEACDAFVISPYNRSEHSNDDCEVSGPSGSGSDVKIQIPFLDDNAYPSAIAVPLRSHPLFSLMSECAVNIIPKYYILAMRCLSSANYSNKDIINFNKQLHRWIIATVVPHLHEIERWYPGFGSIMRVVETMNQRGLASTELIKPEIRESNQSCIEFPKDDCPWSSSISTIVPWLIIIAIVIILLIIIICVIRCCIAFIRSKRSGQPEASDKFTNTLVNLYCGVKGREPPTYSGDLSQTRDSRRFGSSVGSYVGGESSEEEYDTE